MLVLDAVYSPERTRLRKELAKIEAEIAKAEKKLNTPAFREKAPAHVLQEHEKRLNDWRAKQEHTNKSLENLEKPS